MTQQQLLLQENHGAVRNLRLNRPEKKNALSDPLGWAIVKAVEDAAHDDSVRVIAITGTAGAFCAGVDLSTDRTAGGKPTALSQQDAMIDDLGWVSRFLLAMRLTCDKPIVAGINGVAIGAGLSLAMCADMRIASEDAVVHPGYIRAGTSPDGGLSWTLPQLIGHEAALRFLLDPRMVSAAEAQKLGMIGEVVPAAEFEQRLLAYCEKLAALAPIGVRQTKRLVSRASLETDLESHLRDEMLYVRRGLGSADGREAVKAIMEKRAPNFKGE